MTGIISDPHDYVPVGGRLVYIRCQSCDTGRYVCGSELGLNEANMINRMLIKRYKHQCNNCGDIKWFVNPMPYCELDVKGMKHTFIKADYIYPLISQLTDLLEPRAIDKLIIEEK